MNQRINVIKNELYNDSSIKAFCVKNSLSDEDFLNNFSKFVIQKENNAICDPCTGLNCQMDPYGMQTKLVSDDKIEIKYFNCPKLKKRDYTNLDMLFFPNSDENQNKKLIHNETRAIAIKYSISFKNNYQKGKFTKGIYFHGSFGTGKTFMMLKLAQELTKNNIKVLVAYYPDLVRFIKSSIGTVELEKTINKLKYVEVLMLDDIGAESNSNFIRDEVLGPILQFRLESLLPVCFTSNLSLELLKEHFMESKDDINKIKSDRIIERIRFLTNHVELDDINYRNKLSKI